MRFLPGLASPPQSLSDLSVEASRRNEHLSIAQASALLRLAVRARGDGELAEVRTAPVSRYTV